MTDFLKRKAIANYRLVALISGSFAFLIFALVILDARFNIDLIPRWMMNTAPIWLFIWYASIAITIFAILYPFLSKIPKNIYSWIALLCGILAFIWVISTMIVNSGSVSYASVIYKFLHWMEDRVVIVMLITPLAIFSGVYGFFGKVTKGARVRCIFGLIFFILFLLLTIPEGIYSMMTE